MSKFLPNSAAEPHSAASGAENSVAPAPENTLMPVSRPEMEEGAMEEGAAVVVRQPWTVAVYQSIAFAFSALLSPYLVIPFGTAGIVASQPDSLPHLLKWTGLSIFFSTVVPALYVIAQIMRGKITDVHVMEREQRGGPFGVAIISSAVGAAVLYWMGAPNLVWGMAVVLAANGVILFSITTVWKISMHVAVLSATVLAAIIAVPDIGWPRLAWMIPALIWARVTRGRHSIWQGVAGCAIASLVTAGVFFSISDWPLMLRALRRFL